MNLNHYLESVVQKYPNKMAIKFKEWSFTYNDLLDRVCRLANAMKEIGIGKGDVVGLVATNSHQYLEVVYACARIGAITAHFNWRLHPKNILKQIEDSDIKMIFVSIDNSETWNHLTSADNADLKCVLLGSSEGCDVRKDLYLYEELLKGASPDCPSEETEDQDVIQYTFTSGTTSKPKTVMNTNKSILMHSLIGSIEIGITDDDTLIHVLPMFHATISMIYCTLIVGGTIILMDKFDPAQFMETIEREKVSVGSLIPVLLDQLMRCPGYERYDLSSLRSIVYAGAPMTMETFKNIRQTINCDLYQVYGITEMGPSVTILTPQQHIEFFNKPSSSKLPVGKALRGTRIRILDSKGRECPPMVDGEVVVKSDTMMKGYKDPKLTQKVLVDGWFHTGDIGCLDQEKFLYLKDRKNHMIISGGENIYPSEVEACIRDMGSQVLDVAVVGVPDKTWGEAVKAIIVKSNMADDLDEKKVIDHCHEHIASYKKPQTVEFWDELPRNQSGKLLKHVIKGKIQNRRNRDK